MAATRRNGGIRGWSTTSSLAHPNGKKEHNVDFGHHTGTQCFSDEKLSRARATERADSRCSQAAEQQVRRNGRIAESIPDPNFSTQRNRRRNGACQRVPLDQ